MHKYIDAIDRLLKPLQVFVVSLPLPLHCQEIFRFIRSTPTCPLQTIIRLTYVVRLLAIGLRSDRQLQRTAMTVLGNWLAVGIYRTGVGLDNSNPAYITESDISC